VATTTGLVQTIAWSGSRVTARIGPTGASASDFWVRFKSGDSDTQLGFKKTLANVLLNAAIAGFPVQVAHLAGSAQITGITFGSFDICPVDGAVHGDFYSVTGAAIPPNAELVFEGPVTVVTVVPDLVRPHWVFVTALPAAVPIGRVSVRLQAAGWTSDAVPIEVVPGPPVTARTLYPGAPKNRPYTIAFVADPGIETELGTFLADPVLTDRPAFQDAVGFSLQSLLTLTEDVIRQNDRDGLIRLVAVFDATLPANDSNALAHEVAPNLMESRRTKLNAYLARYGEIADVVLVFHGSTTHDRARAAATSDDAGGPGTSYTYGGNVREHRHFPSVPGSAALSVGVDRAGLTPLHEFGHAAADFDSGRVVDLYVDGAPGPIVVNKKFRLQSTDPVPAAFVDYNGTNVLSDLNRDGLGYPANWKSHHPELVDTTRPNAMDNFWEAFDDPQLCRLDRLTYAWLTDRLGAKLLR
jgi:hypothetical protein